MLEEATLLGPAECDEFFAAGDNGEKVRGEYTVTLVCMVTFVNTVTLGNKVYGHLFGPQLLDYLFKPVETLKNTLAKASQKVIHAPERFVILRSYVNDKSERYKTDIRGITRS